MAGPSMSNSAIYFAREHELGIKLFLKTFLRSFSSPGLDYHKSYYDFEVEFLSVFSFVRKFFLKCFANFQLLCVSVIHQLYERESVCVIVSLMYQCVSEREILCV
jgi:hypothetical protein